MAGMIAILGCTASGKSALAEAIAGEIHRRGGTTPTVMAVDSMQVYRGMDIGTSKPSRDIRAQIPHAMIDMVEPSESYSAARFRDAALKIIDDHRLNSRPIILAVGTILYFKAVTEGLFSGPPAVTHVREELSRIADLQGSAVLHQRLMEVDPVSAGRIHPNDRRRLIRALEVYQMTGSPISTLQQQWLADRPQIDFPLILVDRPREDLSQRINRRVMQMIRDGLVDEVRELMARPGGLSMQAAQAVGYKEIIEHLQGRCSLEDAAEQIKINTRHLAKLQRTWLRRYTPTLTIRPTPEAPVESFAAEIIRRLGEDFGRREAEPSPEAVVGITNQKT